MWLAQKGNCTEASLSPSRSKICGAKKGSKDASSHTPDASLGAVSILRLAAAGRPSEREGKSAAVSFLFDNSQATLCSRSASQIGLAPKGQRSAARCSDPFGKGRLKAVRMSAANLCSSICSRRYSWMPRYCKMSYVDSLHSWRKSLRG